MYFRMHVDFDRNTSYYFDMYSRQASVQIENLQEQLQAIAAQRDRAVMDLASIQEQAHQYQTSLSNLQLVLEQFQRGMICPLQCVLKR